MNSSLSRMFLLLCGLLYVGFGLWVLLEPSEAAVLTALQTPPGPLEDLTGSHGGMNVALGLFCIFAALSAAWHRPGLYLVGLINAGYLAGRLVALALDGVPTGLLYSVMALEAILCASALVLASSSHARLAWTAGPPHVGRHHATQ